MVLGEAGEFAIAGLTKAVNGLKDAIQFGDKAQKASLALGETYKTATSKLGGTMDGLRGSFQEQVAAGFAGMQAGMQGNTAGLSRLVNQQRITGTQHAQSAKTMAHLEATLGLSRDATNAFAESFVQTGAEWQVSTGKLIEAVESLKASFPAQALAGMGDKVVRAVTQLTGEFGPQLAGPLNKVMSMVMDTSMKGFERLTLLGIGDVRERLSAAKNEAEAQAIIKDAIITASAKFKTIAGGADKAFFRLGIASEVFGNQAINFTTLQEAFGKRIKDSGKEAFDFGLTLSNLKDEILAPFFKVINDFHEPLTEAFKGISGLGAKISTMFGKWVSKQLPAVTDAFEWASNAIIQGISSFVKWIDRVIITVSETWKVYFPIVKDNLKEFGEKLGDVLERIDKLLNPKEWFSQKEFEARRKDGQVALGHGHYFMPEPGTTINLADYGVLPTDEDKNAKAISDLDKNIEAMIAQSSFALGIDEFAEEWAKNKTYREKANDLLEGIKENTDPEVTTAPSFLDHTSDILVASMARILGIGPSVSLGDLLDATHEQTDAIVQSGRKDGISEFTPQSN